MPDTGFAIRGGRARRPRPPGRRPRQALGMHFASSGSRPGKRGHGTGQDEQRRAPTPLRSSHRDSDGSEEASLVQRSRQRDEDSNSRSARRSSSKRRRKEKAFAWMDSEDECSAEASSPSRQAGDSDDQREEQETEPKSVAQVRTLSQMVRMAPQLQRRARSLPLRELADICLAAARVRFYDPSVFGSVTAAALRHLLGKRACEPSEVVDVVVGLADMNAYDRGLFEAAAQALAYHGGELNSELRARLLKALRDTKHESAVPAIKVLAQKEAEARYERHCAEVAACWQKSGTVSGRAMRLAL